VARLAVVRLDREFFITMGLPKAHERFLEKMRHIGIGYRSLTLVALLAVRNWGFSSPSVGVYKHSLASGFRIRGRTSEVVC
jgi:hypothetical protein